MSIFFGLAQAVCWAVTTILLRSLSNRLDAFLVNGLRAALGLLIIIPLVFLTGGVYDYPLLSWANLVFLASSVVIGGVVGDAFYVNSLKLIGVSRAFPITNSYPLFTVLLSAALLGTPLHLSILLGAVLVIAGVYLIARPRPGHHVGSVEYIERGRFLRGTLYACATALSWSLATVILARGLEGINGVVATSVRVPVVSLLCFVIAARRGAISQLKALPMSVWGQLVLTGILGWGLGGSLYALSIQYAGPGRTAILSATAPLFGVLLGALFLQERPTLYTFMGTLLTISGIALVVI
ncbi:MAG: DMT family transporter [Chloroflexi bacterium]|nr:DMT family transporter [Chloroflexota bacterium]